jgi:hypothetical protein
VPRRTSRWRPPERPKEAAFAQLRLAVCQREGNEAAMARVRKRKGKQIMTKSTSKRPSHRIYAVTKNSDKNFWREIGVAWPHGDGAGFNLKFDYLPLNGAEIVIRTPLATTTETDAGNGGAA